MAAVEREEEVARFDVAMHDAVSVYVFQGIELKSKVRQRANIIVGSTDHLDR